MVTRLVLAFFAFSALRASAQPAVPGIPSDSPCGKCRNLCKLMDYMAQKEALAQIFYQYASSNPSRKSAADSAAMEADVYQAQFIPWLRSPRPMPCGAPTKSGTAAATAWTSDVGGTPPCTVHSGLNDAPMSQGDTQQKFLESHCKEEADAMLAHENLHASHCQKRMSRNKPFYDDQAAFAQSEYEANALHAKMLRDSIRSIIDKSSSGCGWKPTIDQKKDPRSIPSADQLKRMREMGEALRNSRAIPGADLP